MAANNLNGCVGKGRTERMETQSSGDLSGGLLNSALAFRRNTAGRPEANGQNACGTVADERKVAQLASILF